MRRDPNLRRQVMRDERGSVMVPVIGLMAVLAIVTVAITGSAVQSLGYTSSTRAGVQSTAAAESGLNYARAQLTAGAIATVCAPVYTAPSGSGTSFAVTVSYSADATGDIFTTGCPGTNPVQRLKLTSVGSAGATGVAGNTSGDRQTTEAIFTVTPSTGPVPASGAAIYAYSASGFAASGQLVSVDGSVATVHIKTGDVACTGASGVPDAFVVENGDLTISNSCSVSGDLWARDQVKLTGAVVIGGNVHGSELVMTGSAKVNGTGWFTGAATLAWSNIVTGRLTAKSLSAANSGSTPGGTTIIPAGPAPETMPTVADWVDFGYDLTDWPGFGTRTLTTCTAAGLQIAIDALAAAPGVIDARGCSGGLSIGSSSVINLKNDLAIFANKFTLSNSGRFASPTDRRLWLITPDLVEDGLPTCPTGGETKVTGAFGFPSTVKTMMYSPCRVSFGNSTSLYGQVFSGAAAINGASIVHFVPVGLPGLDLSTGDPATESGATSGRLGTLQSIRDLTGG